MCKKLVFLFIVVFLFSCSKKNISIIRSDSTTVSRRDNMKKSHIKRTLDKVSEVENIFKDEFELLDNHLLPNGLIKDHNAKEDLRDIVLEKANNIKKGFFESYDIKLYPFVNYVIALRDNISKLTRSISVKTLRNYKFSISDSDIIDLKSKTEACLVKLKQLDNCVVRFREYVAEKREFMKNNTNDLLGLSKALSLM